MVELAFADAAGQAALPLRILSVQERSGLDQCGRRDHEAVRLDEAEPFEVGAGVGVGGGHFRRVSYGTRQRLRSARSRLCVAVTFPSLAVI